MTRLTLIALLATAVLGCTSTAPKPEPTATTAAPIAADQTLAAVAKGGKDERVCTREYPVGSHLPKRVCMTRAEADESRRRNQDEMQRIQSKTGVTEN